MLATLFRRLIPNQSAARQITARQTSARKTSAQALYRAAVVQAREPVFYASLGVPDNPDGRFELVALHCYAILSRLDGEGEAAQALNQAVFDAMFVNMDENLREMGVGDLKVGKRIREMAEAFKGRSAAFEAALRLGDRAALEDALDRNIYHDVRPTGPQLSAMAGYLEGLRGRLAGQPTDALMAGSVDFGPNPAVAGGGI